MPDSTDPIELTNLPVIQTESALTSPAQLLTAILEMARDSSLDISKLQALLEMQQKMEIRQAEIEFSRSLARFSAQMPQVPKNGRVSLGENKGSYPFAKWEDMDRIIRPLMAGEGFTLLFNSEVQAGGSIMITGTLLHKDGHSRSASMVLQQDSGPGRNNLQAMGSTLSYGKRYTAEMLLNIVREGDDKDGRSSNIKAPAGFGR